MLSITVNGLRIEGDPGPEYEGLAIEPGGFTGWDGDVDVRYDSVVRDGQHGEYDLPSYLGARVTTFSGWAATASPEDTATLGRRLTGVLASGTAKIISVQRSTGLEWARGKLADGVPTFEQRSGDPCIADWQLQLRYPDPRKYGEEHLFTVGQNVPSHHFGNFPAIPVFEVEGVLPAGYTIYGPQGRQIQVTRPCAAGEVHRIDLRDSTLRSDGVIVLGGLSKPDQWTIAPGQQFEHTASNNAVLRTYLTDTYI